MGQLRTTITKRTLMSGATRLYPNIVHDKPIESEEVVQYMVEHSQISAPVAYNAIAALRNIIWTFVLNGHTVKVPEIGTFSLVAKTKAVGDIKKASAKNCIERLKIRYTPTASTKASAIKTTRFSGLPVDDTLKMAKATTTTQQTNP